MTTFADKFTPKRLTTEERRAKEQKLEKSLLVDFQARLLMLIEHAPGIGHEEMIKILDGDMDEVEYATKSLVDKALIGFIAK